MIIKNKTESIYIFAEYNYSKKDNYINLLNLNKYILSERRKIIYYNNVFYRQVSLYLNNTYIGDVVEANKFFKSDIGNTAFVIKNSKNFNLTINENIFKLNSDDNKINIEINIKKYTKISELVDILNNYKIVTEFITDGDCKDLLKIDNIKIDNNNLSILYDNNNIINILEILIKKNKIFISRNGQTITSNIFSNIKINDVNLCNDSNVKFTSFIKSTDNIKNYEIIKHNFKDFVKLQLISDNNPHIVLLSAHLLTNISDEKINPNTYYTSIERLDIIFKKLIEKGYSPVKWEDIVNWKLTGNPIPKKSFNIMIDDFPIDCYTEEAKYNLFKKYNINPGLAMVIPFSGNINDEIKIDDILIEDLFEYNNKQYTRTEIINIIKTEYFLANHTDHSKLTTKIDKNNFISYFNNAKNNNIIPDVIVYPFGDTNDILLDLIKNLNIFKIGIDIDRSYYISNAINNYNLFRCSTTKKYTIEDILNKIES